MVKSLILLIRYYSLHAIVLISFSLTWEEKNQQVLKKVKAAVECDVNKHNPLSDTALENKTFDVITSCLCLSVAVTNMEEFKKALQNIG